MILENMLRKHGKLIGAGILATTMLAYGCGYSDNDPRRISSHIAAVHEIDERGNNIRIHGYQKDIMLEGDTTKTKWLISPEDLSRWNETGLGGPHPYYPMHAWMNQGTPYDTLFVDWKNSDWTHTIEEHIIETYVKPHQAGETYTPGGYHHVIPKKYQTWVEKKK